MGYRAPDAYRTDSVLDALRNRADFRLLALDLAFPAEPFAAPRLRLAATTPGSADQARRLGLRRWGCQTTLLWDPQRHQTWLGRATVAAHL